jgi:hypothetical protein
MRLEGKSLAASSNEMAKFAQCQVRVADKTDHPPGMRSNGCYDRKAEATQSGLVEVCTELFENRGCSGLGMGTNPV